MNDFFNGMSTKGRKNAEKILRFFLDSDGKIEPERICNICGERPDNILSLNDHLEAHHGINLVQHHYLTLPSKNGQDSSWSHCCLYSCKPPSLPPCPKLLRKLALMTEHYGTVHGGKYEEIIYLESTLTCPLIGCEAAGRVVLHAKARILRHLHLHHNGKTLEDFRLGVLKQLGVQMQWQEVPRRPSTSTGTAQIVPTVPTIPKVVKQSKRPSIPMTKDVRNACTFKCLFCKVERDSWKKMKEHFKKNRGHKAHFRECATKKVFHKCLVCKKILLCDEDIINFHVRFHSRGENSKKLTAMEVYKEFLAMKKKPEKKKKKRRNGTKFSKKTPKIAQKMTKQMEAWYEQHWYTCNLCNLRFKTKIIHHLKKEHGLQCARQHYTTHEAWHWCKICRAKIKANKEYVAKHLKTHKETIRQYERRYKISMTDNAQSVPVLKEFPYSQFKCNLCWMSFFSKSDVEIHMASNHKEERKNFTSTISHYSCKLCQKNIKCTKSNMILHAKKVHKMAFHEYEKEVFSSNETNEIEPRAGPSQAQPKVYPRNIAEDFHTGEAEITITGVYTITQEVLPADPAIMHCRCCPDKPSFGDEDSFTAHIYDKHGLTLEEYKLSYNE